MKRIGLEKISKHVVKPINVPQIDPEKIKGYDLIPKLYCTIFLCAKKESGKTNAIFKILKESVGKKTHLYIISSTVFNDDNWIHIVDYFENKGIAVTVNTTLEAAKIPEKVKELTEIAMKEIEEKRKMKTKEEMPTPIILFDKKEEKERKPKKIAPDYIFVFDDMSQNLRDKSVRVDEVASSF